MSNFPPQSPFLKKAVIRVEACQWTGENLDEMKKLLAPYVEGDEEGPFVYADYIEPYFYSDKINNEGYYMLKTEHDEFDPGIWVVVYEDGEIEGMSDEQYKKMGFN